MFEENYFNREDLIFNVEEKEIEYMPEDELSDMEVIDELNKINEWRSK
jgi:hypothetical protein